MKTRFHIARAGVCLLLAASAFHAQAQQAADPQAAVPATRYESALGARVEAAPTPSPDQTWVAANQLVAATNSMALTMKPMAGQAGHEGAQAQAADPHAGHDMHDMHGMQCTAGGDKMSCCQPCCCTDKMHSMNKPKDAP